MLVRAGRAKPNSAYNDSLFIAVTLEETTESLKGHKGSKCASPEIWFLSVEAKTEGELSGLFHEASDLIHEDTN